MDKKRAAIRQIKAIEAHGERLAAIEAALTAPAPEFVEAIEIAPCEPLATAAQIEALAQQIEALRLALAPLIEPVTSVDPKKK